MGERFAAIDVGTNTVLLLIAEIDHDGAFQVLQDSAEITRLGEGVDRTGRIGADGEKRSVEVLARYVEHCRSLGAEEIVAVGTSALRDARNRDEIRRRLREKLGLNLRVLSGAEEAAYSYLAVRKGLDLGGAELLVIDVGGGSTELIWGTAGHVQRLASLDIGSVRLTERYLRSDPVQEPEFDRMTEAIDTALESLETQKKPGEEAVTMIGIAGTFTTLAAIEKRLVQYSHSEVHGSRLTLAEIRRQLKLFQEKSIAERKTIPGLEPKRADVILAGARLIERIMDRFGMEQVTVSDQGIRYGVLHERLARGHG